MYTIRGMSDERREEILSLTGKLSLSKRQQEAIDKAKSDVEALGIKVNVPAIIEVPEEKKELTISKKYPIPWWKKPTRYKKGTRGIVRPDQKYKSMTKEEVKEFEGKRPLLSTEAQPDREPKKLEFKNNIFTSKHPDNVDGRSVAVYIQCTATARSTGNRCKGRAITGTDRCNKHIGGRKLKHGQSSLFHSGKIKKLAERHASDENIKSLRGEIGLLRGFLEKMVDQTNLSKIAEKDLMSLLKTVDEIRKAVKTLVQIEDGLKLVIDVKQVHMILVQVSNIVKQEVQDERSRNRIAKRLGELVRPVAGKGTDSLNN